MSCRLYLTDGTTLLVKGTAEQAERYLNTALPRGFVPIEMADDSGHVRVAVNHIIKIV